MAEDPIVAVATGLVPSALAVIRLSGTDSIRLLASAFSRANALLEAPGHTVHHGRITTADGATLDDVLVSVFREPRSYTGEESVEVSCHGSPAGVRRIVGRMYEVGFRPAEPGEFTRRAFLNGKLDLTRAEAVNEIVQAQTAVAHAMAVDRLEGGVLAAVEEVRAAIVTALAQISIQLDYPEEETGEIRTDAGALRAASRRARSLAATFDRGRLFQEGASVALGGPTNAGKSSLFNALLRQERSIVSDTHGTTRDYVEATLNLDGIPVRLIDTAGLRATEEAVEGEGIQRSRSILQGADLFLLVVDAADPDSVRAGAEELGQLVRDRSGRPCLVVANKLDLGESGGPAPGLGGAARHSGMEPLGPDDRVARVDVPTVRVSATTGEGVDDLAASIARVLLDRGGVDRAGVAPGVTIDSERQRQLLLRCADALDHALASIEDAMPADVVSVDLQDAAGAIGEITGEVASAEILDEMFGSFCVGK